ncbi:multicopper oxidase domain-containing protein [Marimonas arenosa]|uniref:Multicopper oxidase CueO n=1 Tax=Marimonas arenosa TaxID=1795305 RepID=A0AAE3WES9_9RHOB|nr:multicopper oxidase domain-containing protein [Marimonas arenosa]MDQ2091193.1 multicopper oxidase domain-containing protein [Marimonas arenosa]
MRSRLSRRAFLAGATALALPVPARAQSAARRLVMPPLLDARAAGRFSLRAAAGQHDFLGESPSDTAGFNRGYLGPVVRIAPGETEATVENAAGFAVTSHWHGLEVPGEADGGPHQTVAPGATWRTVLPVEQPPATAWYHSHIHGQTAPQVHAGLAGVLQILDGRDGDRGLPSDYGVDDLMLVLQDRRFDQDGRMVYRPTMHDRMVGHLGDWMVVNGQVDGVAAVPPGVVRLRLLNASNARIYRLTMRSGRGMHLVATEGGYLPTPLALDSLLLSPGERAEVLVDFAGAETDALVSDVIANMPMLAGGQGLRASQGRGRFTVLDFTADAGLPVRIDRLPDKIGDDVPEPGQAHDIARAFSLDMGMGMHGGFAINGASFAMERMDHVSKQGQTELWRVRADRMMHPFHVHGTRFRVLSENGQPPRPEYRGWKDTVLIDGEAELLMRFNHPAPAHAPYMFHCHILEHEDAGMMGQFSVA